MTVADRDIVTEHKVSIQVFRLVRDRGEVTSSEVAKFTGLNTAKAGQKLRQMRDAGILGVKGVRANTRTRAVLYGFGADTAAGCRKGQPLPNLIAFASLIRALENSSSVTDIVEETGVSRGSVHRFLRCARAWRIAYISAWTPPIESGPWIARWKLGANHDYPQPKARDRKVINAKNWAKRAERKRAQRLHDALTLPLAA